MKEIHDITGKSINSHELALMLNKSHGATKKMIEKVTAFIPEKNLEQYFNVEMYINEVRKPDYRWVVSDYGILILYFGLSNKYREKLMELLNNKAELVAPLDSNIVF